MIKLVYRNTLSCEAIVRRAPNKELILVCQCGGLTEPAVENRVFVWHSKNNGDNWSKPCQIIEECGKAVYQTEVSVIENEIRCYITIHNGNFLSFEHRVLSSMDSGYTWNDIGEVPLLEGFTFIRGLLVTSKNLHILPYQNYPIGKKEASKLLKNNKYIWDSSISVSETGVLISNDGGKTYTRSKDITLPLWKEGKKKWHWTEPTLTELSDGKIAMLMRIDGEGYLYMSISCDEGKNWSGPVKTAIPNPSNKVKLINMKDGKIALIHTPNKNPGMWNRNPLSVWISDDDMVSWKYKKTLVDFIGWLSYPDGFIENQILYLAFDFNRHDVYYLKMDIDFTK